jgi:hypothetical protein
MTLMVAERFVSEKDVVTTDQPTFRKVVTCVELGCVGAVGIADMERTIKVKGEPAVGSLKASLKTE